MKILFIGDSLTEGFGVPFGYGWVELWQGEKGNIFVNKGQCGAMTAEMIDMFRSTETDSSFSAVCIFGGTNDILSGLSVSDIMFNIEVMIDIGKQRNLKVMLATPPAMTEESYYHGWQRQSDFRRNNEYLSALRKNLLDKGRQEGIVCFDFYHLFEEGGAELYGDGVHPNKKGYALMAAYVNERNEYFL